MIGAGRDEDGLALGEIYGLARDLEAPRACENDIDLVDLVRLLAVGLRRDEHVDAELEPGRRMHDLVPALPGGQSPLDSSDIERFHASTVTCPFNASPRSKGLPLKSKSLILALALAAAVVLGVASSQAAPGDLDPSFGENGVVTSGPNGEAIGVAIQPDGKIVAAGSAQSDSGARFAVARYSTDGTLDASFGQEGQVTTGFGASDDNGSDVAIQADGMIVVAGTSFRNPVSQFALVRYKPGGSLDPTFGTDGKLRTAFGPTANAVANALVVEPGGKIVVAGYTADASGAEFALARYNPNGTLDTGFGTGGKVTTSFPDNAFAIGMTRQPDGKIVVAGALVNYDDPTSYPLRGFALARYKPDGSLDPAFGSGGKVTTSVGQGSAAFSVALQADGKIVAGGSALVYGPADELGGAFALVRYGTDGTLDGAFGSGGEVTTEVGTGDGSINAVALRPDGKIVVAGTSSGESGYGFALARYQPGGSLDTSFGTNGQVHTDVGTQSRADDLALQADGKIVASGFSSGFALVRYLDQQPVCVVPNVVRRSLTAANHAISVANCSVGTVKRVFSRKVKKAYVISQKPDPATRLADGAAVDLTVSKGKRPKR